MKTRIHIGNYIFVGRAITQGMGNFTKAMCAETLSVNTLTFNVVAVGAGIPLYDSNGLRLYDSDEVPLFVQAGEGGIDLDSFTRGLPVEIYRGDDMYAKMYFDYAQMDTAGIYTIHLTSAAGILSTLQHMGGMYNNALWGDICADIMSATLTASAGGINTYTSDYGWTYTVPDEIKNLPVNNRLQVDTRRNNLLQLLFPYGISLLNNLDGSLEFTYNERNIATGIPDENVGEGGGQKVPSTITKVSVTEHEYRQMAGTPDEAIFEITLQDADHLQVIFTDAYYDLTATALSGFSFVINESNCNYAVVTGRGTLTGKKYTHYTSVYSELTGNTGADNEVAYENMTLVSMLNSANTLQRLVNYYKNAVMIQRNILMDSLICGDLVNITPPMSNEKVSAWIQSLSPNFSSTLFGTAKLIANYTPGPFGPNISTFERITANQTWYRPANLDGPITVVLISGGQGGQGGQGGSSGNPGNGTNTGQNGAGGSVGAGGAGGKVYSFTIDNPDASYEIVIGAGGTGGLGGAGGAAAAPGASANPGSLGALGADGGETKFGTYTSNSGNPGAGFINPFTGEMFGTPGLPGVYAGGSNGDTIGEYTSGGRGNSQYYRFQDRNYGADGGQGGGPAYGASGGNGNNAFCYATTHYESGKLVVDRIDSTGGTGGTGGDATIAATQTLTDYGAGGRGGNGAGGGGGGGGFLAYNSETSRPGYGGTGGTGGTGSSGNPGAVLIFYKLSA